ncbi:hypothetical protein DPMN_079545 [Dreissena polymorpha]|uniref:Uncharacterized protein n=1 Tax=Dreissena polymorpha TaxID=45954 RepID=A0A9D3YP84_DREPO|nr:hypothetical protein DPMN_079545 [Dreissena polymorpha]
MWAPSDCICRQSSFTIVKCHHFDGPACGPLQTVLAAQHPLPLSDVIIFAAMHVGPFRLYPPSSILNHCQRSSSSRFCMWAPPDYIRRPASLTIVRCPDLHGTICDPLQTVSAVQHHSPLSDVFIFTALHMSNLRLYPPSSIINSRQMSSSSRHCMWSPQDCI